MQFVRRLTSSVLHSLSPITKVPPTTPALAQCATFKPVSFTAVRNFQVTPISHIQISQPLEQKKARKLFEHMYGGGDNGGVDYGHEIMFNKGVHKKTRPDRNPLRKGTPFAKAVVIKTVIKKPKKPNSANRKCVLVRLSSGREITSFVPKEGHNLQEHNVVLVRPGRLKDCPGVKTRCVRGKYDLPHVIKKETGAKK